MKYNIIWIPQNIYMYNMHIYSLLSYMYYIKLEITTVQASLACLGQQLKHVQLDYIKCFNAELVAELHIPIHVHVCIPLHPLQQARPPSQLQSTLRCGSSPNMSLLLRPTPTWKIHIILITVLHISTSVKIIKNEVGCRDDTVPKTVETRRHCEED